jgi:hypothetical protein
MSLITARLVGPEVSGLAALAQAAALTVTLGISYSSPVFPVPSLPSLERHNMVSIVSHIFWRKDI